MDELKNFTLADFAEHIGTAKTPLVGGGCIAGTCGMLSASLCGLVGLLSADTAKDEAVKEKMLEMLPKAEVIREELLDDINKDAYSFSSVMDAFKMPKNTDEEKKARSKVIQEGYKHAISVPFGVAEASFKLFDFVELLYTKGNKNAETDVLVAAMCTRNAVLAALYNVKINLLSVKDEAYVADMTEKANKMAKETIAYEQRILSMSTLL